MDKHSDGGKDSFRDASLRVSIPTVPGRMKFLMELVRSLNSQTFREFDIALIVSRGTSKLYGDLDSNLHVDIIEQKGQGFMDAMQTTVRSSGNYDININLDDDSLIGRDHVEKYMKAFSRSKNVGVIFGTEENNMPGFHGNLEKFLKFNQFINRRPLTETLAKYSVYFNSAGILSGRRNYKTGSSTILGQGTNMAWISEALAETHLPSCNEKFLGILNEQYLALQAVFKGYEVRVEHIDSIPRKETRGESLSSDSSIRGYDRRLLELYSSPVFVNSIAGIDAKELKRAISKMKLFALRGEVRIGIEFLRCSLQCIESGFKEDEAVNEIEKLWNLQTIESRELN